MNIWVKQRIHEGYNQPRIWSLKKKLAPKSCNDPPAAKRDEKGKLVTKKSELEQLYLLI